MKFQFNIYKIYIINFHSQIIITYLFYIKKLLLILIYFRLRINHLKLKAIIIHYLLIKI